MYPYYIFGCKIVLLEKSLLKCIIVLIALKFKSIVEDSIQLQHKFMPSWFEALWLGENICLANQNGSNKNGVILLWNFR